MPIRFLGPEVKIERVLTGFWSFDNACANNRGERGFAIPAFTEVYAKEGVGKTAFVTTIAGLIADNLQKNIAFLDWEIQDFTTIGHILENQGFEGTLQRILEKKDEESMDKFYDVMEDEAYGVGIMDSIAAFSSIAEQEGKQSDANMGKRGMNMAKFSRTCIRNMQLRKSPAAIFATNHMNPIMGSMVGGMDTPGGEAKKFMSTYRILLKKFYWKAKKKTVKFPEGWVLEGRLDKNRTGYAFTTFHVAMVMGEGLHKGFSALFDCLIYEHADLDRIVKMDGESYGTLKSFIDNRDNAELFVPFQNKLRSVTSIARREDDEDEETEE